MDEMKDFANELGIRQEGQTEDGSYVIELADSDEYSRAYSLLDKSDKVDLDGEAALVFEKMSELTYLGDDFDVRLVANFTDDVYKVIIEKAEE